MSQIKTTELEGDVSIGRHVTTGGNATIRGNATVGKNLKVEGWLDAKNIKGPNKGIFLTVTKLREAYPLPHDGWWALVGNTLPAPLYIADGGAWVSTGESAGNPTIDSQQYNEAVAELDGELQELTASVGANKASIEQIMAQVALISNSIISNAEDIKQLQADVKKADDTAKHGLSVAEAVNGRLQVIEETYEDTETNASSAIERLTILESRVNNIGVLLPRIDLLEDTASTHGSMLSEGVIGVVQPSTFQENDDVSIEFYGVDSENNNKDVVARITGATDKSAGVMTVAHVGALAKATDDIAIIGGDVEALKVAAVGSAFVNANGAMGLRRAVTFAEFLDWCAATGTYVSELIKYGTIVRYLTEAGWKQSRYTGIADPHDISDAANWENVEGGAAIGNSYNVTNDQPRNGYYDLTTAIKATYDNGYAALGMNLTFAIAKESWKTYQYMGDSIDWETFKVEDKWLDLAGMSAGSEPFINVNALCGAGKINGGAYTLSTAITAILDKQKETGITYAKDGIVITYMVSEGVWECKQLKQSAANFGNESAWEDFGGAGTAKVETKDTAADGGTDAYSTGGAYMTNIVKTKITQEDGTVEIQLLNAAGEDVLDEPIKFLASQGGGDSSGTIVSVAIKDSPLYGAIGMALATKAAIRSVTTQGKVETENTIVKVEIIDKDTNAVVWTQSRNQASSSSLKDYSFDIDFTPFFSVAAKKTFYVQATDDTGKTGRKQIQVEAEDVTLTCRQDLSKVVYVDETAAYLDMYSFDNIQSEGGIRVHVELFDPEAEEWKTLHTVVETKAFTRGITINVAALGLGHNSYIMRMYGESVNSGVRGNTVYSTLMVVDPSAANSRTLIAIRYDDASDGKIRLYDTVSFDFAAYHTAGSERTSAVVDVMASGHKITQILIDPVKTVNVRKQISGFEQGEQVYFSGKYGALSSAVVPLTIDGSVLDIDIKDGAVLDMDFNGRSNKETDHTIEANGITMDVVGANWTSNGFIDYAGATALRIAENVRATLPFAPFGDTGIEQTGAAIQFKIATRNIRDKEAHLIDCYDPDMGAGFYLTGNNLRFYSKGGVTGIAKFPNYKDVPFDSNEPHTIALVVEPQSVYKERDGVRYSMLKVYLDGGEAGSFGYVAGRGSVYSTKTMSFDGTDGDLYLYYMLAYRSYYEWAQAFDNYLVKGTDTEAMVEEYDAENVLISQTAEGSTSVRPSSAALWERGVRCLINVNTEENFTLFDYGNGSEDNGLTTSPKFKGYKVYYRDPVAPWRSFIAADVTIKRQGTTSTLRPLKNEDYDFSKATIAPLFPEYGTDAELRATLTAEQQSDVDETIKLFALGYIRIGEHGMPIQRAMCKVDYSDSTCANNGGVCDMMNDTYRTLGGNYMTPAQRFYDGTWDKGGVHIDGIEMNHSIANVPCAIFRSTSDTLQNVYFHARASFMESKKEQAALGFRDVSGYNKGCLNYGDFKELFAAPGQNLAAYVDGADKSTWEYSTDPEDEKAPNYDVIVISEYCGRSFKVFRRDSAGAAWRETTGTMKQVGGKWVITGDVLNPVTGYELLSYTGMCWWMGVSSVDEMMAPTTAKSSWVEKLKLGAATYPAWTQYFECLIEDDQLAIDYAMGRKVPYELYSALYFMNTVDYSKLPEGQLKSRWTAEAWKFMSIESVYTYHVFTDYLAAVDQRAKNMQPMWFLEDGAYIQDGVYLNTNDASPMRMYLNKVYDCDTCNGADNDGGRTVDPEVDPDKATNEAMGYTNPYAGWGSILFNNIAKCKEEKIITGAPDDKGESPYVTLTSVAQNMRGKQKAISDNRNIAPFSPEGARYYFLEQRINKWPKKVCSYDCERKYIDRTDKANQIYFYANNGNGRSSTERFIQQRWLVRDGFYQTGGFFTDPLVVRINCREEAAVRVTAGARGYFAVGYENVGQLTETVFLEEGESYEFTKFSKTDGTKLYIYQVARLSRLDLSDLSLSDADFSKCTLLEELIIGGEGYTPVALGSYAWLAAPTLGTLPFLRTIDVRNTAVQSLDCSGCARLEHIYADGSKLQSLELAPTSPINDIHLPATMSDIKLVDLPKLSYAGGMSTDGLHLASLGAVRKLRVEDCPHVNAATLLRNVVNADGSELRAVRVAGGASRGDGSELLSMIERGVTGLDANGDMTVTRPVVLGDYYLTRLIEQEDLDAIGGGIEGLNLIVDVEAYIAEMVAVNGENASCDPDADVETPVTVDNIGAHVRYYNGETYAEWLARFIAEN